MLFVLIHKPAKYTNQRLDLLQKSFMEIGNGRDEAESESKAFSSISVSAAQDSKALECSQDVFDANAA